MELLRRTLRYGYLPLMLLGINALVCGLIQLGHSPAWLGVLAKGSQRRTPIA